MTSAFPSQSGEPIIVSNDLRRHLIGSEAGNWWRQQCKLLFWCPYHWYVGLWHCTLFFRMHRFLSDFGYDWYFMLSLWKFLHEKTDHKISIVSKLNKKRCIRTKNKQCHSPTNTTSSYFTTGGAVAISRSMCIRWSARVAQFLFPQACQFSPFWLTGCTPQQRTVIGCLCATSQFRRMDFNKSSL